jgi:hypothetical protein
VVTAAPAFGTRVYGSEQSSDPRNRGSRELHGSGSLHQYQPAESHTKFWDFPRPCQAEPGFGFTRFWSSWAHGCPWNVPKEAKIKVRHSHRCRWRHRKSAAMLSRPFAARAVLSCSVPCCPERTKAPGDAQVKVASRGTAGFGASVSKKSPRR